MLVLILVQGYGLPLSIQTTLFFAGIGTLFFHICTKLKVPAFLGSSFAYLGGFEAMAKLDAGKYAGMDPAVKLQYACGGIVVAGLLYVILAAVIKAVGVKKVMRFLPPVVTGPIIILIGLNLAPSAVSNASTCWWLAIVAMAIIVAANIWGKGMVKIIPILLGVVGSYVVALIANAMGATALDAAGNVVPLIDFSGLASAAPVGIQPFFLAKFDLTSIFVMAPIAIAAIVNSIPTAIIGGVSFILYGMISAIGVRNVVENRVDFTNSRNLIIAAIILVCGLGFSNGITFSVGEVHVTLTNLAIAAIAGIALNAILPGKDYEFGADVTEGRSGDFGRY